METGTLIESPAVPSSQLNLAGVLRIPAVRQVVSLIGVAGAVAAGFAIVLWSQTPQFTRLHGDMSTAEATEVAEALQAANITYKLTGNGSVMVAESELHEARLQLATQGLPQSTSAGMDLMQEQSSFGVSQFMESARYQHALQADMERTIASIGAVKEARVHLALPKQTAFIRDNKGASASVFLKLYGGRLLEADQAAAIVQLVASSVPNLVAKNVTLIDQHGRLLSSGDEQAAGAQAATQFKFSRRLEETYKKRIEDLLTPLVGAGRVRAEVVADVDFTYTEETRESFDPARAVVRSEQISEDETSGLGSLAGGVPGALSNQPPEATGDPSGGVESESQQIEPKNSSRSSVRNYEVDRTISHTRPMSGAIRKLSVAVLIDNTPASAADTENSEESVAPAASLSDVDVERYTALVKEAVGFNDARGDSVVVLNEAFLQAAPMEEPPAPALWERPGLRDILKQVLGAILVLAIAFGIVRPMLRGVVSGGAGASGEYLGPAGNYSDGAGSVPLAGTGATALAGPNYDEKVAAAKNLTGNDPARVAQVVKKWVSTDG
ncbi:MAG: flagellar basal-body MS-ring/collar protein FliF [Woeseiaceae bacterium]